MPRQGPTEAQPRSLLTCPTQNCYFQWFTLLLDDKNPEDFCHLVDDFTKKVNHTTGDRATKNG
jgi:hypothetical protein